MYISLEKLYGKTYLLQHEYKNWELTEIKTKKKKNFENLCSLPYTII